MRKRKKNSSGVATSVRIAKFSIVSSGIEVKHKTEQMGSRDGAVVRALASN